MRRLHAASTSAATCPGNACISHGAGRTSAQTSSSTIPRSIGRGSSAAPEDQAMARTVRKRKSGARRNSTMSTASTDILREIALRFPDVEDATTERGLAFKARGRLLVCSAINESADPGSVVIRIGAEQRARLMAAYPSALYLLEHYAKHPAVL